MKPLPFPDQNFFSCASLDLPPLYAINRHRSLSKCIHFRSFRRKFPSVSSLSPPPPSLHPSIVLDPPLRLPSLSQFTFEPPLCVCSHSPTTIHHIHPPPRFPSSFLLIPHFLPPFHSLASTFFFLLSKYVSFFPSPSSLPPSSPSSVFSVLFFLPPPLRLSHPRLLFHYSGQGPTTPS